MEYFECARSIQMLMRRWKPRRINKIQNHPFIINSIPDRLLEPHTKSQIIRKTSSIEIDHPRAILSHRRKDFWYPKGTTQIVARVFTAHSVKEGQDPRRLFSPKIRLACQRTRLFHSRNHSAFLRMLFSRWCSRRELMDVLIVQRWFCWWLNSLSRAFLDYFDQRREETTRRAEVATFQVTQFAHAIYLDRTRRHQWSEGAYGTLE